MLQPLTRNCRPLLLGSSYRSLVGSYLPTGCFFVRSSRLSCLDDDDTCTSALLSTSSRRLLSLSTLGCQQLSLLEGLIIAELDMLAVSTR